ncbi:MAG: restriction endonuclease subunit S [Leptospiraceae bacterium]|nr:restriction endonuclease subunit S [Leptospiraceae bacterium]
MKDWKECKLGDVAEIQTGPFGSQLHMSDYKLKGTPIITVEHLGDNRIIHNNLPLVSDEDKDRLKKYILKEGDIVFSRVGSVDRSAYVHKKENGWMFSGRLLRVRSMDNLVYSRFLSFYFCQNL